MRESVLWLLPLFLFAPFPCAGLRVAAHFQEPPRSLEAMFEDDGRRILLARTTAKKKAGSTEEVVTDTVRNDSPNKNFPFGWMAEGRLFAGQLVPGSVKTQKWNTFRNLVEADGQMKANANTAFPAHRWVAENAEAKIVMSAGELYATLIDGSDGKEKVLFECMSVLIKKGGGFVCEYKATNRSNQSLTLDWAGFRKELKAGMSFKETIQAAQPSKETSGTAVIRFEKDGEYTITANYWKKP